MNIDGIGFYRYVSKRLHLDIQAIAAYLCLISLWLNVQKFSVTKLLSSYRMKLLTINLTQVSTVQPRAGRKCI